MTALATNVVVLLTLAVLGACQTPTDYCGAGICWNAAQTHVACNNNGSFGSECQNNPRLVPISDDMRTFIVAKHNTLRNNIARGAVTGFSAANRMAPVRWSPELATIAAYGVRRCQLTRDQCRNTAEFPYVGQNTARSGWGSAATPTPRNIANNHIQAWFDQNEYASQADMNSFRSHVDGHSIAQFAQIVNQRVTHIGCAILRQTTQTQLTQQLMFCNYAAVNQNNQAVYAAATGAGAQGCTTGTHATFKFLCSFNEVY